MLRESPGVLLIKNNGKIIEFFHYVDFSKT